MADELHRTTSSNSLDESLFVPFSELSEPTSPFSNILNTDLYQITMAYALWKADRHMEESTFELFFRKNPFKGEYTVFAGLDEVTRIVAHLGFTEDQLEFLRERYGNVMDSGFFDYLKTINGRTVKVYAQPHGSLVFPRTPLIRVDGPAGVCQLLETPLLNAVNYASLVSTNARRMRMAAGPDRGLVEFGLRRAQGPDGGLSASKYTYVGGFEGTSNVQASYLYREIDATGTHAHSYVLSFGSLEDVKFTNWPAGAHGQPIIAEKETPSFIDRCVLHRKRIVKHCTQHHVPHMENAVPNDGELAAFIAYAQAFPGKFLALVDTYDTLASGLINAVAVSIALAEAGYQSLGIRLDSGDLAFLSRRCRFFLNDYAEHTCMEEVSSMKVFASSDISESVLHSLNEQQGMVDVYGIGTSLVTCSAQAALGCVYKLVESGGHPRIKLSNSRGKTTLPGMKTLYRLFGKDGYAIVDLLALEEEKIPAVGEPVVCHHPYDGTKRVIVKPSRVEHVLTLIMDNGTVRNDIVSENLKTARSRLIEQMKKLRPDHWRSLNPTPYKVSITEDLFNLTQDLMLKAKAIKTLE